MAVEKIVTLCKEGDSTQEYYPNIKGDNIPSNAVAKGKLTQALQDEIDGKAPQSTTYTKSEIDNKLSGKVNVATYNAKVSELETAIGTKANSSDVYTKTATDTLLDAKADADDVYAKDETYNDSEIDDKLNLKADKSTTYTKTETDTLLDGKQATLESGTNIKTINNQSLLGSGNISVSGGFKYNVISKTFFNNTQLRIELDKEVNIGSLLYVHIYDTGMEEFDVWAVGVISQPDSSHIELHTTGLDYTNTSLKDLVLNVLTSDKKILFVDLDITPQSTPNDYLVDIYKIV